MMERLHRGIPHRAELATDRSASVAQSMMGALSNSVRQSAIRPGKPDPAGATPGTLPATGKGVEIMTLGIKIGPLVQNLNPQPRQL